MIVVAIDGPAGAGKSTVARDVALALGFTHVDSGALYRAVALAALDRKVPLDEPAALEALARELSLDIDGPRIWIAGVEETSRIRSAAVTEAASRVAAVPGVRTALLGFQRGLAAGSNVVIEGRDIGTVVFPEAPVKIYLTASIAERARRRHEETAGVADSSVEELVSTITQRDEADSTRETSPLTRAPDAAVVDSTGKSVAAVVDQVLTVVTKTLPGIGDRHLHEQE